MVMPATYLRHTLVWNLPDGEVANCRVHWLPDDPMVSLDDVTVDDFASRGDDLWTSIKGYYNSFTVFIGSRVQWIGTDSHILATQERFASPSAGTATTGNLPTEVALVASLTTPNASRSGRGRIYLPAPALATVNLNGRMLPSPQDDFAAASAAYLGDLVSGSTTWSSVVASETQGAFYPVISARVGNVYDVQRRRRDSIAEGYVIYPVT